jgi:4-hydroxy-2-oxoheptanedioate aldolase
VAAENPLLDRIQERKTSIGVFANSADMVELCAFVGFHWVMIDQMFTSNDWSRTEDLIRAAEASGITPVVRIQSNPWLGYDHRVAVDVSRANGIGAQFMMVSHSGKQEIDECVLAGKDWHRKALNIHPYRSFDDWEGGLDRQAQQTFVIPQPETRGALDSLEEVIKDPDIRIVFIAMTDASRIITGSHRPDFYNQRLWEYVDRAVALGKEHGVTIGANTSYAYNLDEMRGRVEMLVEHGVRVVLTQGAPFLFQLAATDFLTRLAPVLDP